MEITETNSKTTLNLRLDIATTGFLRSAIVFGHADADGHLAAEQTGEWLAQQGINVKIIVSSETRNYHFWGKLANFDLSNYDMVIVVDIAFRFRDPSDSLTRLLNVSDRHPRKQFIVIDHHPLMHPPRYRENVQLIEVADPYDCCLGVPEPELMQVAALCDGSPTAVTPAPLLKKRALGVKRAAADVSVAGDRLLKLIRERQWSFFEALADEDHEMHRSARGFRRTSSEASPMLECVRSLLPSKRTRSQPELSTSH